MTKLGVQGGPEEEVKQDVVKDPKVFTVVQPTFVPIPIQTTEPMRKSVPSTWCLMARLLAIVLVGSLLFSLLVFAVWNKDEVARAITGEKSTIRTLSEPQFAALNSQVHAGEVEKKEEPKDDGAQITIKQTGEGTQMIIQMPKSDETKDGAKTAEDTPAIPMLRLVPARERSEEDNEQQVDSQEMMDGHRRPMHPYEMEGPSPDALNFGMHPMMALQAARAAQYENEMRAWRMRRLQQMLFLAAVQQAQQQAALRYAYFHRQQWAAQQMAMQQAMEARRQAEWQEYWRRAAIARMMQQQAMQQMQQQQQQPVASSWQAAEQPRPWFTQQQQPMMQWPQQQFFQQQQWQAQQQQQPMMQQHPFWMQQQQQQPQIEPQGGAQVPQSQPLFLFQQALQARLRERMQMQHTQQLRQEAAQHDLQQHQEMPQMQQQSDEESQEQPEQPQPQPHAFIFIRRFFPIPQDSREQQPPQQSGSSSSSSEESNEKNIPLRPHDASAQQIVEQMRGGPNSLPDAPLPGIHDRIFQHFQTLSQQMQDRSGQSQAQSQPPLFASIPNSVEQQTDSQSQSQETHNYDQDAIYEKLQRQSMQLQHDGHAASVQTDSAAASSASHSKEDDSSMVVVDDDDHDIRRGDAVLGAFDTTAQIDADITTTTEPVMIENVVRAQSEEKDDEDKLTPEEKRKVAQLDSAELKEAAALEASLEREANEQNEKKEAELVKVEEEIVHEANKDSSSASEEKKESEEKEDEPVTLPAATTIDPLSEFFRFFEKEAVKLSAQDKQAERVVVDSETGTHSSPVIDELNDEENSSEHETKPDEMPEELPSVDSSKDSEEVAASIDTAPVSNEAEIKVSQVANSREIGPITIAAAA